MIFFEMEKCGLDKKWLNLHICNVSEDIRIREELSIDIF